MSQDSEFYANSIKELDWSEFRKVFENLDGVKDLIPDIKRRYVERLGAQMEAVVRKEVGGTGKVASWQKAFIGKYSGYAAVRPKTGEFVNTKNYSFETYKRATSRTRRILSGGHYPVAHVTNAIDLGHDIRSPSGMSERYAPKIYKPWVEGKHFYRTSQAFVNTLVATEAQKIAEDLAKAIEKELSR